MTEPAQFSGRSSKRIRVAGSLVAACVIVASGALHDTPEDGAQRMAVRAWGLRVALMREAKCFHGEIVDLELSGLRATREEDKSRQYESTNMGGCATVPARTDGRWRERIRTASLHVPGPWTLLEPAQVPLGHIVFEGEHHAAAHHFFQK